MRKIAAALSTVLALSSCSTNYKHLAINLSPQAEVVQKNEYEGIKDLRQLVEEAELEEAWAYIPRTNDWHDIGLKAKMEDDNSSVEIDAEKLISLAADHSSLHLWHIHTRKGNLKLWQSFIDNPPKRYIKQQFLDYITAEAAVPSYADLGLAFVFTCSQYADSHRDDRYFLASPLGVTEFRPSHSNLYDFCTLTPTEDVISAANIAGNLTARNFDTDKMVKQINKAVVTKTPTQLFDNSYMKITFTPYEALSKDLESD